MKAKSRHTKLQRVERSTRLILSHFLHLFTPNNKTVYNWKEILIGLAILAMLCFMASFAANR